MSSPTLNDSFNDLPSEPYRELKTQDKNAAAAAKIIPQRKPRDQHSRYSATDINVQYYDPVAASPDPRISRLANVKLSENL